MITKLKTASIGKFVLCAGLLVFSGGCDTEEASSVVEQVGDSAAETMDAVKDETAEAADKAMDAASELSEKATAYLNPLKEKFGNLESLKDKPEELKEAVTSLIASIEERAEGMELPEKMSEVLATAKEKLMTLKQYLEGEVDQAKIDEQIQELMTSIKSQFGMSE